MLPKLTTDSETVLKKLIDEFHPILKDSLGNFYDTKTDTYIEPIVVSAMLHQIHYFYRVLGTEFIKVSGCEKEAKELLDKNLNDLKEDLKRVTIKK